MVFIITIKLQSKLKLGIRCTFCGPFIRLWCFDKAEYQKSLEITDIYSEIVQNKIYTKFQKLGRVRDMVFSILVCFLFFNQWFSLRKKKICKRPKEFSFSLYKICTSRTWNCAVIMHSLCFYNSFWGEGRESILHLEHPLLNLNHSCTTVWFQRQQP